MDYRLVLVFDDASTREIYCSTQADVLHQISANLSNENDNPTTKIMTYHVAFTWKD